MDQARLEQIKQRVDAATPWPNHESDTAFLLAALAEAQTTITEKDSELEAAYKTFYRQKNELEQAQATIQRQASELAELSRLRADAKRLDWLDCGPCFTVTLPMPDWKSNAKGTYTVECGSFQGRGHTLRKAIDAAMAAQEGA